MAATNDRIVVSRNLIVLDLQWEGSHSRVEHPL